MMNTTQQPERRGLPGWAKILIAFGVIGFAALLLGGFAMLTILKETPFLEQPQPKNRAEIEAIARIKIPASATNIHAKSGGFQDRFIHVRFDIPPADLEQFLGATRYTPSVSETTTIPFQESIEPKEDWWQPRKATRFLAGSGFVDGISQSVLIDTSNPALYIVYVATFET